jgi:hypothetical protein
MNSDDYHEATEGRRAKVTWKTAAPRIPLHRDSADRLISTARKRPTISQTQKLLLAAIRLWELKNGYRH